MTIDSTFGSTATAPVVNHRPRASRGSLPIAQRPEIISEPHNYPYPWRIAVALTLCAVAVPALFVFFIYCCERIGGE